MSFPSISNGPDCDPFGEAAVQIETTGWDPITVAIRGGEVMLCQGMDCIILSPDDIDRLREALADVQPVDADEARAEAMEG